MIYQNGRFRVVVAHDGAIQVKHGDWLSKYSKAIYNDFKAGWGTFGRRSQFGGIEPIKNPHRIYAGETIYHIPTHCAFHGTCGIPPKPYLNKVDEHAIEKSTVEELVKELELPGHLRHELFEIAHQTHRGLEVIAGFAEFAAEGTAAAGTLGGLGEILFPFVGMAMYIDQIYEDRRVVGCLAFAYTVTAWAFDGSCAGSPDPVPPKFSKMFLDRTSGMDRFEVDKYKEAWKDSAHHTLEELKEYLAKKGYEKLSLQLYYRLKVGQGEKKVLAKALWKATENRIKGAVLRQFMSGFAIDYPN
jgi:hypothetical protein